MTQHDLTRVPGREHYSSKYVGGGRIFSFAHQIHSVKSFEPRTVMEVGAGGGMVTAALRSIGFQVTTVDVQEDLRPDVLASVTELPFTDGQFDVGLCCQVLEHLPFDSFVTALTELCRVCHRGLVLSLPDVTRFVSIAWALPLFGSGRWSASLPKKTSEGLRRERLETSGHYWEIGFPGASKAEVTKRIQSAGWTINRTWRVPELCWHRFFVLTPMGTKERSSSIPDLQQ